MAELVITLPDGRTIRHKLGDRSLIIGRDSTCDIPIDDPSASTYRSIAPKRKLRRMNCCDDPERKIVGDLNHTLGEFKEQGVENLILLRCPNCNAYRLDVRRAGGRQQSIAVSRERGDRICEANGLFFMRLRSWARS